MRRDIKYGADWIKLMGTGGVLDLTSDFHVQELSEEQMAKAVEVAHRAGKRVMVHAEGTQGIKAAARAGVDTIEHGTMMDDEGAALMAKKGIWLVPTLQTFQRGVSSGLTEPGSDQSREGSGDSEPSAAGVYAGVKSASKDCGGNRRFAGIFAEGSRGARSRRNDPVQHYKPPRSARRRITKLVGSHRLGRSGKVCRYYCDRWRSDEGHQRDRKGCLRDEGRRDVQE